MLSEGEPKSEVRLALTLVLPPGERVCNVTLVGDSCVSTATVDLALILK